MRGSYTSRRLVLKGWGSEEEVFQFAAEGQYELIQDESSDIRLGIVRDVLWRLTPHDRAAVRRRQPFAVLRVRPDRYAG